MKALKNFLSQNKVKHTFSSCQWPFGDPQEKDFYFCGAKPFENKPYCAEHCNIAYVDEKELKKSKDAQKHKKIASSGKEVCFLGASKLLPAARSLASGAFKPGFLKTGFASRRYFANAPAAFGREGALLPQRKVCCSGQEMRAF